MWTIETIELPTSREGSTVGKSIVLTVQSLIHAVTDGIPVGREWSAIGKGFFPAGSEADTAVRWLVPSGRNGFPVGENAIPAGRIDGSRLKNPPWIAYQLVTHRRAVERMED